ncbi:hypothetical protein DL93DRAFT_2076546 [Clavulina sp. PMI_390]|nr:hypothetical protein DL93DRAFT_2076546 [Clavulina sp. PMI_390]
MREALIHETPSIPPALATRITLTAVAHALYSRGQVPFPVTQLANIPVRASKNTTYLRAIKKRDDLLNSYENLDAQLASALHYLSWTLALIPTSERQSAVDSLYPPNASPKLLELTSTPSHDSSLIHLMVVIGASLNAPKARVMLELHDFDAKPFGWRDDLAPSTALPENVDGDGDVDALAAKLAYSTITSSQTPGFGQHVVSNMGDLGEDVDDGEEEDVSFAETSFATSAASEDDAVEEDDESDDDEDQNEEEEEESDSDIASDHSSVETRSTSSIESASHKMPLQPRLSQPAPSYQTSPISLPQLRTSTISDSFLKSAERIIHRALTIAPVSPRSTLSSSPPTLILADEDEIELPLSETTLLIRAPRRFRHPSFLPKQVESRKLDDALREYLKEGDEDAAQKPQKKTKAGLGSKVRTTGLRVRVSAPPAPVPVAGGMAASSEEPSPLVPGDQDTREDENEMIWFQWTGKLKGISDELF